MMARLRALGAEGRRRIVQVLAAVLYNTDARSGDYAPLKDKPRPSHGDYTAAVRAQGYNDPRGGGHTSGRLTAPLTAAGAIALTYLRERGITVHGEVRDEARLRARAAAAKAEGDSVGGVIRCTVTGLPAGLGGPDWRDTVEGEIARHIFAIPGVKAIGFGAGEDTAGGGSGGGGGGVAIPVGAYLRKGDDLRFEPNVISLLAVGIPFVWVAGRALSRVIRALNR